MAHFQCCYKFLISFSIPSLWLVCVCVCGPTVLWVKGVFILSWLVAFFPWNRAICFSSGFHFQISKSRMQNKGTHLYLMLLENRKICICTRVTAVYLQHMCVFAFRAAGSKPQQKERRRDEEMELSITVAVPQEGGDSQPIDRFAFEGLSCHTFVCVYVCCCVCACAHVLYCVCLRWRGGGGQHKDQAIKR